ALVMKCTHQDWNLIVNPKGFNCSLHGSSFALDGSVTTGPPTDPLKKLTTTIKENQLIIS
ncbi:MAG: Rieske 2Fe-2S domain-containing protein, partial [Bacteroidia bacterium]|nr:Rieske 2Fe-2S domain-containing protein [Bacteroidia bacterium]